MHFSKIDFFFKKNTFVFLGRKSQKSFRGQSSVPPGGTKKGVYKFWQTYFLSWVCSAILAQLIYRFCGAILIAQSQRNDMNLMTTAETVFDDHRSRHFSAQARHF